MAQTIFNFDEVLELPLSATQATLVADMLASQKRERKSYLFVLATDSYAPGTGSVPRLQMRIIDHRVYGKISKLLTNNQKEKV